MAKATGVQLAKAAALISTGIPIAELRISNILPKSGDGHANGVSVKEAVLPFNRFRRVDGTGIDTVLGPEMKSTGESILFIDDLKDDFFRKVYGERNLYLSR